MCMWRLLLIFLIHVRIQTAVQATVSAEAPPLSETHRKPTGNAGSPTPSRTYNHC